MKSNSKSKSNSERKMQSYTWHFINNQVFQQAHSKRLGTTVLLIEICSTNQRKNTNQV